MFKKQLIIAATALAMSASVASAGTLAGNYWDAPSNSFDNINAAITYANNNALDATFTSTGIAYGDAVTPGPTPTWDIGSLADFLNADAGSIAGTDDGNIQESVFQFTGFVSLNDGDDIFVTSDDGFRLIIGGSTFSEFVGIRAPNNTTSVNWSGGSGIFEVTLWYFEGQETQAQLISNLAGYATMAPVPLPAGAVLILTAFGGLAVLRRRKAA